MAGAVALTLGLGALLIKGGFLVFIPVLFLSGCWVWALKAFLYYFFCLASLLRQERHDSAISKSSLLIPCVPLGFAGAVAVALGLGTLQVVGCGLLKVFFINWFAGAVAVASGLGALLIKGGFLFFIPVLFYQVVGCGLLELFFILIFFLASLLIQEGHDSAIS